MVEKVSLVDNVVREVVSLICRGVYKKGMRIPAERELCKQFNVSRPTLRAALSRLQKIRVLDIKHNSGAYVRGLVNSRLSEESGVVDYSRVSLEDIITARRILELPAVELACANMTAAKAGELKKCLERMAQYKEDLLNFINCDMTFHRIIVGASKNKVLMAAFDSIYEYHKYSQIATSYMEKESQTTLVYHSEVYEALRKKDVRASKKALERHFDDMERYLKKRK